MPSNKQICILGLGNVLCGDDGFGCHAVAMLQESYSFPPCVTVIDAGTQGQLLPGVLKQADSLLLLDAADFDQAPGALFEKNHEEIPIWLGMAKLSAHQGSFAEAMAHAMLLGYMPENIHLIGFQPVQMEFGDKISPLCHNQLNKAIQLTLNWLHNLGIAVTPAKHQAQIHPELRAAFLPDAPGISE